MLSSSLARSSEANAEAEAGHKKWPGQQGVSAAMHGCGGREARISENFPGAATSTQSQGVPGSTRIQDEPGGSRWPGGESPTLGEIPGHRRAVARLSRAHAW